MGGHSGVHHWPSKHLPQLLSTQVMNGVTRFTCHIGFHEPVRLLQFRKIQLRCLLGYVSSEKRSKRLFRVDGDIVKNEDMVIIGIVLLKDVDSIVDLSQNLLVDEAPSIVCSIPKRY